MSDIKYKILKAMMTDDGYTSRDDAIIKEKYEAMTSEEKNNFNMIMISLCGYSFETLMKG